MMKRLTPKEQFWFNHIETFLNSGLSQVEYCQKHGFNSKSFSARKSMYFKRKKVEKRENVSRPDNFLPLKPKDSTIQIKLSSGLELSFDQTPDPVWMGKVLHSLEREHAQH